MVEGDKYEMYIPSELAYGERGSPPQIGPNEVEKAAQPYFTGHMFLHRPQMVLDALPFHATSLPFSGPHVSRRARESDAPEQTRYCAIADAMPTLTLN